MPATAFDPSSALAAGVELEQLLWVRCRNIDHAFRATDLLIQGGGFGLIALDLSDIPPETVRHIPLNAWFRFRRAVEDTPTILVVLEQEPHAKTCASLVLRLEAKSAQWSATAAPAADLLHPPACLFDRFEVRAEMLRSRMQAPEAHLDLARAGTSAERFVSANAVKDFTYTSHFAFNSAGRPADNLSAVQFRTKTIWSYHGGLPSALKQTLKQR